MLGMYVCLVISLYKSRGMIENIIKVQAPIVQAENLLPGSPLDDEVPEPGKAVIIEPDVSGITENSILVFVQSHRSHVDKRYLIRHTWGDHKHHPHVTGNVSLHVIFAIGNRGNGEFTKEDINIEIEDRKDILLLNMNDEYNKLTLKGYLTMSWINKTLPFVKYVIKTDDDIFLNPFAWINMVLALQGKSLSCVIIGYVWTKPKVLREGKYSVTKKQFKFDDYPSFCSGAAYLIPHDSMAAILEASSHIPLFLRDDPYFTGMTAQAMGIRLMNIPKYTLRLSQRDLVVENAIKMPYIVIHDIKASMWYHIWHRLLNWYHHNISRRIITLMPIKPNDQGLRISKLSNSTSVNYTIQHQCASNSLPPYISIKI